MDNLFTHMHDNLKPLAEKMRPISLDDFVGQQHILGEGKLLRRLIQAKKVPSCIFLALREQARRLLRISSLRRPVATLLL